MAESVIALEAPHRTDTIRSDTTKDVRCLDLQVTPIGYGFTLRHVNDLPRVFMMRDGEVVMAAKAATVGCC